MKIFIFSDSHGSIRNIIPYLENGVGCSRFIFAGDLFGYLKPNLEMLRKIVNLKIEFVLGNHDLYYLREISKINFNEHYASFESSMISSREYNEKHGYLYETCQNLKYKNVNFLLGIPLYKEIDIQDKKIIICHASPDDPFSEYIYPDSEKLHQYFLDYDFDLMILGHTHVPFIMKKDDRLIVNPGSCTLPRGGMACPSFIVVDLAKFKYELIKIEQNVKFRKISKNKLILIN